LIEPAGRAFCKHRGTPRAAEAHRSKGEEMFGSSRLRGQIRARGAVAVLGGVVVALLLVPAASLAGSPVTGSGGAIGSFSFFGKLKGKLTVDKTWTVNPGHEVLAGCQITTTSTDVIIDFFNAELKMKGRRVVVNGGTPGVAAQLEVDASQLGTTESLAGLNATALVTFNAIINGKSYVWASNTTPTSKVVTSGTLTTKAGNTGGSVDATMAPGTPAAGGSPLTIKGSWSHCQPFKD
jgi:hypothetical protein